MSQTKKCILCGVDMPLERFRKKTKKQFRINVCRGCDNYHKKLQRALYDVNRLENIQKDKRIPIMLTDRARRWNVPIVYKEAKLMFLLGFVRVIEPNQLELLTVSKMKKYLRKQELYTCRYCGEYGDTIDHLKPRESGGADHLSNWIVSCLSCNCKKANKPLVEFLKEDIRRTRHFKESMYYREFASRGFKRKLAIIINEKKVKQKRSWKPIR